MVSVGTEKSAKRPMPKEQMRQKQRLQDGALGLVSTRSFPAIVGTADMMLKSAEVSLVGYEKIGSGYCTAIVRGKTADVRLAVEEGAKTAQKFGQLISQIVIPRPMPNLEVIFPIHSHLREIARQQGHSKLSYQALGLLETRGFPALVGAADAMLKAAEVQLAAYETIGDGLCTAIIRGSVSNVAIAVDAGMYEAERIGELNSVMVIPRPLEELEDTLPVASCWIEKEEPLPALLHKVQEKEQELVKLPALEELSIAEKVAIPRETEKEEIPIPKKIDEGE